MVRVILNKSCSRIGQTYLQGIPTHEYISVGLLTKLFFISSVLTLCVVSKTCMMADRDGGKRERERERERESVCVCVKRIYVPSIP